MRRTKLLLLPLLGGVLWAQPVIQQGSTVNAADYSRNLAPGSIVTIFGLNLAPGFVAATALPLPTSLGGTSVEITDGVRTARMPLYWVLETQLAGQLPYDMGPNLTVRVQTGAGTSGADRFALVARAPALFSVSQEGAGRAVVLHPNGQGATRQNPVKPGQWISIYANSLGPVEPPIPAGSGAGDGTAGNPWNVVSEPVDVTLAGRSARVGYAGLTPYLAGLFQINAFTPFYDLVGDLVLRVRAGSAESPDNISIPVEPNGWYLIIGAGKFPNGQTKNAVPGPGAAIVFRHENTGVWGQAGFRQWTFQSPLGPQHAATSGFALTLRNQGAIVYDNNGIEDGTHGGFYDNSSGAVSDSQKPGLWEWYSMSNDLYAIFAGHFRLTQVTTFDEIVGYFDGNGHPELRFDPNNVYNRFRMNIWSNGAGDMPAVNSVTGDVFTSDTTAGTFQFSATNVRRVFSDGAGEPIFRMVYRLAQPLTLQPGNYWFSHDCAVPEGAASPVINPTRAISNGYKPLPPASTFVSR